MKIRSHIEIERIKSNLTKAQMAGKLKISPKSYSCYVNGNPIPSSVLFKMAIIFGRSSDYLLEIGKK